MLIVLTFCVIGFLCLIYSHWERNQLKTEQYLIFSKKIKKKFRFVFLTDLHEKEFGVDNAVLTKKNSFSKAELYFDRRRFSHQSLIGRNGYSR